MKNSEKRRNLHTHTHTHTQIVFAKIFSLLFLLLSPFNSFASGGCLTLDSSKITNEKLRPVLEYFKGNIFNDITVHYGNSGDITEWYSNNKKDESINYSNSDGLKYGKYFNDNEIGDVTQDDIKDLVNAFEYDGKNFMQEVGKGGTPGVSYDRVEFTCDGARYILYGCKEGYRNEKFNVGWGIYATCVENGENRNFVSFREEEKEDNKCLTIDNPSKEWKNKVKETSFSDFYLVFDKKGNPIDSCVSLPKEAWNKMKFYGISLKDEIKRGGQPGVAYSEVRVFCDDNDEPDSIIYKCNSDFTAGEKVHGWTGYYRECVEYLSERIYESEITPPSCITVTPSDSSVVNIMYKVTGKNSSSFDFTSLYLDFDSSGQMNMLTLRNDAEHKIFMLEQSGRVTGTKMSFQDMVSVDTQEIQKLFAEQIYVNRDLLFNNLKNNKKYDGVMLDCLEGGKIKYRCKDGYKNGQTASDGYYYDCVGSVDDSETEEVPAQQQKPSFDFKVLDGMLDKYFDDSSVWKNDEGGFNTARLASDSIAGVILGTTGGIVTSKIIKKNQIKSGFESLKCTIGGQDVANFGDEFKVGVK